MVFPKSILLGASLLVGTSMAQVVCSEGLTSLGGNCYQNEVDSVVYENVGFDGSYNTITNMIDGVCSVNSEPYSFSGPLAPLNEPVTWHLRGPLELSKFAVYYPTESSAATKQKKREASHLRRHVNRHLKHKHKREVVVESTTQYIYVTKGTNDSPYATEPTAPATTKKKTTKHKHHANKHNHVTAPAPTGDWTRTGLYDADAQTNDGLVFLNNMGNSALSGSWTPCFGNTLSFMGSDGVSAAASSQVLEAGTVLPSDKEYSIWTSEKCDASCGYCNTGSVAYKGFDGDHKVFVFRFRMPHGTSANNNDMPAIWALNSKIGRTQQYPANKDWSCWASGGGEFDALEVLSNEANMYLTSHLHSNQGSTYAVNGQVYGGGGVNDYIMRPVDQFKTVAISFIGENRKISIKVLDDSFDFGESLDTSLITGWSANPASKFYVPS